MKGIIFNLAEEVISAAHGDELWEELLETAGVDGAYTSLGSYPDGELAALVTAAAAKLGVPAADVLRRLGEGAIPLLAARFPVFFEGHTTTATFVGTLNHVIHAEVRKLYPDAEVPDFIVGPAERGVVIDYRSHRRLCALAEGFIVGAARHFGERAAIEQPECMLGGDDRCLLACTFA